MAKGEFGFIYGAPKNLDKTWETEIDGCTFTFKKKREKSVFLYNCSCHGEYGHITSVSSTGFYSDRDLTPVEVEKLPQFSSFISEHCRSKVG